jgi:hypothetical protein
LSKFVKIALVVVLIALACSAYLYYPIYIGQNRFHTCQSVIKISMTRENVLALANDIGYLEHVAGEERIETNGKKVSINIDTFTYSNFLLPSAMTIEYSPKDLVERIVVEQ